MLATVSPALRSTNQVLSQEDCQATLGRTCFGHLAFAHDGRADVMPVRFAFIAGWLYFRADLELRMAIATNPVVTLAVTELRDITHFDSVIVRGGCYETEMTGAGIALRLRADEMQGTTTFVPCQSGEHAVDRMAQPSPSR